MLSDGTLHRRSALVMRRVMEALQRWTALTLAQAGLEHLVVQDRALPLAPDTSSLLLLPYEVGPYPKLREPPQSVSLFEVSRAEQQEGGPNGVTTPFGAIRNIAVSESWIHLALAISSAVRQISAGPPREGRPRLSGLILTDPHLPPPLQKWFHTMSQTPDAPWASRLRVEVDDVRGWVLPYIGWQTGMVLQVSYILLAQPGGPLTEPPRSADHLPALAALASAMFAQRTLPVPMPGWPIPEALEHFILALLESLPDKSPVQHTLHLAFDAVCQDETVELPFSAVQDFTEQSFALLMQALRLPLQPALNLRLQVRLADGPELAAGAVAQAGTQSQRPPPTSGERPFGAAPDPASHGDDPEARQARAEQLEELRQHPLFADMPTTHSA